MIPIIFLKNPFEKLLIILEKYDEVRREEIQFVQPRS